MSSSSSSSAAACSSAGAVPASPGKICFNAHCKERVTERPTTRRRGWRLRSGELSELCDRCSVAYDQGNFCETFHLEEDGWRKCQSCGKRVHCGCVVSIAAFMLLDAGGIECMPCARKSFAMGTNSLWSSSIPFPLGPEKLKDLSAKSWNQIATSSSVPGQWRQASNMWNTSQSELQQRLSYEFDRPNGTDRLMPGTRLAIPPQDKKKVEDSDRAMPHMNHVQLGIITNGKSSFGSLPTFSEARREDGNADGLRDSSHPVGETDTIGSRKVAVLDPSSSTSAGINFKAIPVSTANVSLASAVKDEPSVPLIGLPSPFPATSDLNDSIRASSAQTRQLHVPPLSKQNYPGTHNAADAVVESQNQARNGKPRADGRCRSQLLPRYWPRITDQELQQINGDPNSVITPLFEKMLSASDAGRIGRLVLPKKCAEAYFPPISQPEGVPLKVQDARGQEWAFQFRFWPNNNSRMYVLEGVTPCIQSMKLQAGDIVTFSRIEPEGKLIMGFRKASNAANEQEGPTSKSGHGYPITKEASYRNGKPGDGTSGPSPRLPKGNSEQRHMIVSSSDQTSWSKVGRAGFIQKEGTASKPSTLPLKRKSNWLGAKSKRLRMENEDSIELKLTWEEAQELLRPPPDHKPSIVIIEGHEFEEYEEAPVLGKPTIFTTNEEGEKNQWARCEDCLKWRKLPANALLPPRWTCLDNSWDPEKSSCSSPQEITTQQLADLLHCNNVPSKKSKTKAGNEPVEASDGLDTLANLAIMGEGESSPCSSQPTTRHPRHRPGCTCIVCIQPPSGKGPKHKQTCQCNVCLTVKRRFRTLMLRKEKRQSEKEAEKAEAARKKHQEVHTTETPSQQDGDTLAAGNAVGCETQAVMASPGEGNVDGEPDRKKALPSPIKTQIDLNIQPEREEEPSPLSNAGNSMRLLRDAAA